MVSPLIYWKQWVSVLFSLGAGGGPRHSWQAKRLTTEEGHLVLKEDGVDLDWITKGGEGMEATTPGGEGEEEDSGGTEAAETLKRK